VEGDNGGTGTLNVLNTSEVDGDGQRGWETGDLDALNMSEVDGKMGTTAADPGRLNEGQMR